jgi:hypothetical protein
MKAVLIFLIFVALWAIIQADEESTENFTDTVDM